METKRPEKCGAKRWLKIIFLILVLMIVVLNGFLLKNRTLVKVCDSREIQFMVRMAGAFYRACLSQCSGIERLLEASEDEYPRAFQSEYRNYMDNLMDEASALESERDAALYKLQRIYGEGGVIAWSQRSLDEGLYEELIERPEMRMDYYSHCAEFLRALRENPEACEDGYAQAAAYLADVIRADEAYSTSLFQLTARMLVGARQMQAEGYPDDASFERMTQEQQKELMYASDSTLRELCIIRHETLAEAECRLRIFWETAVPLYGLQDVPELPRRQIERSAWNIYGAGKPSE